MTGELSSSTTGSNGTGRVGYGVYARLVLAAVGVAVAVWLIPASIHVVGWEGGVASRVALVPPLSHLAWVLATALALVAAVAGLAARHLRALAVVCLPLALLLILGLPYLPVLGERLPLVLVLAGPGRWVVVAVAVGMAALAAARALGWALNSGWSVMAWAGRRGLVCAVSLVVFLAVGVHIKSSIGLSGDEPHYLVIAHSLMADGDVRIENNHSQADYLPFWPSPLPMHYLQRGVGGVIYSVHAPGLPALLLPLYALASMWGAVFMIGLLGALTAVAVFDTAASVASRGAAVATWMAIAFTVPFVLHGSMIFPEMPAALIMAWLGRWLWTSRPTRSSTWLWRGAALGYLPWLHTKFSVLLAVVTLALVIRLWPRVRDMASLLAPIAVSGVLWLASFYVMYGSLNPTVVYGFDAAGDLAIANIPRGLLGLAFDQEFGLLWYTPVFVLVVPGAWMLLRHPATRWQTVATLLAVAAFLGSTTQYYMWWGGTSVPARFLVPLLPLAAPLIAVAFDRARAPWREISLALLCLSLFVVAVVVYDPRMRLMFNERDGTSRLIELWQAGVALTAALPSFIQPAWVPELSKLGIWVLALLLAVGGAWLLGRRITRVAGVAWVVVLAALVFSVIGVVLGSRVGLDTADERVVRQGRQSLLQAYDADRLRAVSYDGGLGILGSGELFGRATLVARPQAAGLDRGRFAGPFDLAPGRYEVRVSSAGAPEGASIWVRYDVGPGRLGEVALVTGRPALLNLDLPVRVNPVWIGTDDEATANAISRVDIVATAPVPRSDRTIVSRFWAMDAVRDTPGRYALFMDQHTFSEPGSYWVRGGRTGRVLVSPAGARELAIRIQNGATAGRVTLATSGVTDAMELSSWEAREVRVPLTGDEPVVPVVVGAEQGFRPSEVDPSSRDTRWLGAQVTLSLR